MDLFEGLLIAVSVAAALGLVFLFMPRWWK
jgi:hypothetical protein